MFGQKPRPAPPSHLQGSYNSGHTVSLCLKYLNAISAMHFYAIANGEVATVTRLAVLYIARTARADLLSLPLKFFLSSPHSFRNTGRHLYGRHTLSGE
jgi:hypothetical protein